MVCQDPQHQIYAFLNASRMSTWVCSGLNQHRISHINKFPLDAIPDLKSLFLDWMAT
jgi:hypothetical protein